MSEIIVCTPKPLPHELDNPVVAAQRAIELNPVNAPPVMMALIGLAPEPDHLAVLTTRYWGAGGVHLTVGFLDNPSQSLRGRIISHMNAWGKFSNVKFVPSNTDPKVRIARGNGGYWSYLGTDILGIPRDEPTMNLQGFTDQTPEREFVRVVRHETGHTLGMPHEHMRRDIVARIDPDKAIVYFKQTQGWSANTTRQQVLTPLNEASLKDPTPADELSIMSYQLPGSIMRDGQPVIGGLDINRQDADYAAHIYPVASEPEPPVPPTPPDPPGPARTVKTEVFVEVDGVRYTAAGNMKPAPRQERSPMLSPEHQLDALHAELEAAHAQAEAALNAGDFCGAYPGLKATLQKVAASAAALSMIPLIGSVLAKYASSITKGAELGIKGLDVAAKFLGCPAAGTTDGVLS